MAVRYPGSKKKLSKRIVALFPPDAEHYYEPFLGLGYVFELLMLTPNNLKTFHLSDVFRPLVNFHRAVKGDTTYGDIIERLREARQRLLPEAEHEPEIRAEFYKRRERLRHVDDPFDWMFVQSYAFGQYCGRFRKNIASFDPQYLGGGLKVMTLERLQQWRSMLQRAELARRDALELLRELSQRPDAASCFCYLDPSYIPPNGTTHRMQMFQHELTVDQHRALAEILKAATFRFVLSIGDGPPARELYVTDESFRTPFRSINGFYAVRVVPANSGRRKNQGRKLPGTPEWMVTNYDIA
jgi:site-specific DNA-adenine methylase